MATDVDYALAIAVVAEAVAIVALLILIRRYHPDRAHATPGGRRRATESRAKTPEGKIEDVFLLHRSGLLLKHYTKRLQPNMDSDVLSGMLTAVQEFVKDAFRGAGGPLEISFGDKHIKVIEGKWTVIAALISGPATEAHVAQMSAALKDLESRYEDLLIDWDGTMDKIPEVDRIILRLLEGGYQVAPPASAG